MDEGEELTLVNSGGTATAATRLGKVPEVTLLFWSLKIIATTLGETGGDALSMSAGLGYLASTGVYALLLAFVVSLQVRAHQFHPGLYWATIVATTTVGTTLADFADRSLGIGYAGGTVLLAVLLGLSLLLWKWSLGSVAVGSVASPRAEMHYWLTITLSQTLGTALGDWAADSGLGYAGGTLLFGSALLAIAAASRLTKVSRTALFWAAFILTRPLGATVGDLLDKPVSQGGLALSRYAASAVLLAAMAAGLVLFRQRAVQTIEN
jgi:uncharacterized membrane-anchored protein